MGVVKSKKLMCSFEGKVWVLANRSAAGNRDITSGTIVHFRPTLNP
jgi:hypothetical protein